MRYENIKTSKRPHLKQQRMVFLSKVTSSSTIILPANPQMLMSQPRKGID
jgi:hypothetical protein